MKPESNRPIALEDLLRLKRAERPPAEFWTEFDRELRTKQLAALVEKRPWWQRMPSALSILARYRIPLGASAVLALTLLSVREYHATSPNQTESAAPRLGTIVENNASRPDGAASSRALSVEAKHLPAAAAQPEVAALPEAVLVSDSASATELSRMMPFGGASGAESEPEEPSPSARAIAANLAMVQNSEPISARNLLDIANGYESRASSARTTVEPLQQITPPSDSRRARLLTAMVSTASLEAPARTSERAASRIAEDRLYDQIHRFGARGDRLQVKF